MASDWQRSCAHTSSTHLTKASRTFEMRRTCTRGEFATGIETVGSHERARADLAESARVDGPAIETYSRRPARRDSGKRSAVMSQFWKIFKKQAERGHFKRRNPKWLCAEPDPVRKHHRSGPRAHTDAAAMHHPNHLDSFRGGGTCRNGYGSCTGAGAGKLMCRGGARVYRGRYCPHSLPYTRASLLCAQNGPGGALLAPPRKSSSLHHGPCPQTPTTLTPGGPQRTVWARNFAGRALGCLRRENRGEPSQIAILGQWCYPPRPRVSRGRPRRAMPRPAGGLFSRRSPRRPGPRAPAGASEGRWPRPHGWGEPCSPWWCGRGGAARLCGEARRPEAPKLLRSERPRGVRPMRTRIRHAPRKDFKVHPLCTHPSLRAVSRASRATQRPGEKPRAAGAPGPRLPPAAAPLLAWRCGRSTCLATGMRRAARGRSAPAPRTPAAAGSAAVDRNGSRRCSCAAVMRQRVRVESSELFLSEEVCPHVAGDVAGTGAATTTARRSTNRSVLRA